MTYDNRRQEYSKEHIWIVELDLDYCSLTHGVPPCTATETGDAKCFNTLESCNDVPNYTKTTKTYRFCEDRSPHPIGLKSILGVGDPDVIPCLLSVNTSPAKVDIGGGLGIRAKVSCSFKDFPHSDINIDEYINDRTYIASDRGTFWTKLRARNPNYQFRALRVLSGYLVNGEFDSSNFTTRYYVIETMNVSNGRCSITAKDPLKLAANKKAQAPVASSGQLASSITASATSAQLDPPGIGAAEYPTSGKITIGKEVMSFTRINDTLTLTRAQNNTTAISHAADATCQIALEYTSQTVNTIVEDLCVNYANIDSAFIPTTSWQSENDTFLSGNLSGIITKPTDVNKLLKELSESMPHYLWWDERAQIIQFTALKQPPASANVLDMDSELVEGKFGTTDKQQLRLGSVFFFFGQFDPTQKLDETNNYEQTYARIDTDSIAKFTTNEIKTVFSRWITSQNKAAALQAAALIGRRFSKIPREVKFSLEPKNGDVWVGQNRLINHRDITDFTGLSTNTLFQITSSKESRLFDYTALEFDYGDALPEDEGGGDPNVDLVIISVNELNLNLRTRYDSLFGTPSASTQAKFVIENGVVVGSSSNLTASIDTGSWPAGATVTLQPNSGSFIVGKGGDGGGSISGAPTVGGLALLLNNDITIDNSGVVGGGGGGGGNASVSSLGKTALAGGGGGAGSNVGVRGLATEGDAVTQNPQNGTTENGGVGGQATIIGVAAEPFDAIGGDGGDLGQAGSSGVVPTGGGTTVPGAAAGAAIDKNGYTLTETQLGDVRGSVLT